MRAAAIPDLEHLRLEPLAVALIARHEDVGEELHLDPHLAFALARFAAAARHVEGEVARRQPARTRILGGGKQLADRVERLEIRDRVRPRRSSDRRLVDEHRVGDELGAFEFPKRADALLPAAFGALDRGVQHVVHERRLAGSADAGHAGQHVQRDADVDVLQVVLARAEEADLLARAPPPRPRHRNRQLLAQILRGERARLLHQSFERARKHHAPALLAGAQPQIDDVIGDPDHVGVVLDHDHRVALVAELPQDVDQPLVVARVQADGGLVEHIQRADQRGTERGREVDALRLAAGKRRGQPIEGQIFESHVAQKRQPPPDLLEDLLGDRRFLLGELQRGEEALRLLNGERRHPIDRLPGDAHVARFAPEARAAAVRTREIAPVPAEEHAHVDLVFLPLEPAEEAADPGVVVVPRRADAFDDEALLILGQIGPRHVEADLALARDSLQLGQLGPIVRLAPRLDRVLRRSTSTCPARPDSCRAR